MKRKRRHCCQRAPSRCLISEGRNTDPNFERYTRDAVALPAGLSTQPAAAKTEDQVLPLPLPARRPLGIFLLQAINRRTLRPFWVR
jgi:hypothetical protein